MVKINPKKITHVIFDMDGLMFDNEPAYIRGFVEGVGKTFKLNCKPEDYFNFMGKNDEDIAIEYARLYGRPAEEWKEASKINYQYFWKEIQKTGVIKKPGLDELIEWLYDRKIPFGIASGSAGFIVKKEVELAGLNNYFDDSNITDGASVNHGKPHPEIFLKAMSKIGCKDPSTCLVLEDSKDGIRAAKNGGFPGILIPDMIDSYSGNEDCCFACLSNLSEVIPILENLI